MKAKIPIGIIIILVVSVLVYSGELRNRDKWKVMPPCTDVSSHQEVTYLESQADAGDIEAVKRLEMYYMCIGGNLLKEVDLMRKGARLGDATSRRNLYVLLHSSKNPEEVKEGLDALRLAAEQGDAMSMVTYADIYRRGDGVKKDLLVAEEWYKKAAFRGSYFAPDELMTLLSERAKDVPALSEAYGWSIIALEQSKILLENNMASPVYIDSLRKSQHNILIKAIKLGANENDFISRSEEWAREAKQNIPIINPKARQKR